MKGDDLMFGRIIGGVLLVVLGAAVAYEIIDRENPELADRIRGWFSIEDDFIEPEDVPAE